MSYQITLQASGHTFAVEENEFILEAALRQGVNFPYGCRSGSCGTCLGSVVSGQLEYPEGLPITLMEHEVEEGKAIFCTSVAKSDMVIDVKEVRSVSPIDIKLMPARVSSLKKLSSNVMQMKLSLPAAERLKFRAGQYIEFILSDKTRRAFSLANTPSEDQELELHLRLVEGGKFTEHVFNQMKEKAIVRIEGPFGSFAIAETSNRPLILMAGGTGFAPIKSMVEQLIEQGDTRLVHVYWGAQTKADLYLNEVAQAWDDSHLTINYQPVLSDADKKDDWKGSIGFVHKAVISDFNNLAGFDIYMAGSPAMIDAAKKAFIKKGMPEEQIFSDSFEFSKRA
ncbi:MAG: CDP-6-deoxy-delta-3,4-glucoseen reductase [Cocleimonas sp.]